MMFFQWYRFLIYPVISEINEFHYVIHTYGNIEMKLLQFHDLSISV